MPSLIPADQAVLYRSALDDVFWTFARPFQLYIEAQTAVISTSLTYSRFGAHDENAPIDADNTAVIPQVYTLTGCILYDNRQPWETFTVGKRTDGGELKLRDSNGIVRIKVDSQGNDLLKNCKLVSLDGFSFQLNSNARPHGLLGAPTRWSYTLEKTD